MPFSNTLLINILIKIALTDFLRSLFGTQEPFFFISVIITLIKHNDRFEALIYTYIG